MTYNPLDSLRSLRSNMQREIAKHESVAIPGTEVKAPLAVVRRPTSCCVLLKALTDGGPVPADFTALKSAAMLRAHVRSDGAVYLGAFELAGHPDSIVLVYGDPAMRPAAAERLATLERAALQRRHASWQLGPFASHSHSPTPTVHSEN